MTIARDPRGTDRVPVGPGLSMFDPMFIGIDEFGQHVTLDTVYHNLLIAGEPGAGKSGLVNIAASTGRGNIWNTDIETWDTMQNVNVRAPFFMIQGAAKIMRREGIVEQHRRAFAVQPNCLIKIREGFVVLLLFKPNQPAIVVGKCKSRIDE